MGTSSSSQLGDFRSTQQRMSTSRFLELFETSSEFVRQRFPGNRATGIQQRLEYVQGMSRRPLAEVIAATLPPSEYTPKQQENVDLLVQGDALAVVTGQQCGFLGGPLYTLYKAATAVAQARDLQQRYDHPVVPVFWVEDNDHDLHEIATASQVFQDPVDTRTWFDHIPAHRTIAGAWTLDEHISLDIARWVETWQGPFAKECRDILATCYASGNTVSESFTRLTQLLLGETGIVFVSAKAIREQGLFQPPLATFLQQATASQRAFEVAEHAIAEFGLQPSASSSAFNVFGVHDNKRYRLGEHAGSIVLRETKHIPVDNENVTLSPNVVTRNICQDSVLPTIMYVSGPGELAYQSVLREQYELANVPMPVFFPRMSAVLCDTKTVKLNAIADIEAMLFAPNGYKQFEQQIFAQEALGEVESLSTEIEHFYQQLKQEVGIIDPTLEPVVMRHMRKAQANNKDLHKRIRRVWREKKARILAHFEHGHQLVLPGGSPQERVATSGTLLALVGVEGVRHLLQRMISENPHEQVFIHI